MDTLNTPRPLVSTKRWEGTYLGRRARTLTEHHDSRRDGLRTITTEWIDDADPRNGGHKAGTVTRRVVKGDGWKRPADFVVIVPETIISEAA